MVSLEHRILQELIYERVRVGVNLCELVAFERELDYSIKRALAACPEPVEQRGHIARKYVDDAWQRIEAEWDELRLDIASSDEPDDGP